HQDGCSRMARSGLQGNRSASEQLTGNIGGTDLGGNSPKRSAGSRHHQPGQTATGIATNLVYAGGFIISHRKGRGDYQGRGSRCNRGRGSRLGPRLSLHADLAGPLAAAGGGARMVGRSRRRSRYQKGRGSPLGRLAFAARDQETSQRDTGSARN